MNPAVAMISRNPASMIQNLLSENLIMSITTDQLASYQYSSPMPVEALSSVYYPMSC